MELKKLICTVNERWYRCDHNELHEESQERHR